jgi:hypothetical protein
MSSIGQEKSPSNDWFAKWRTEVNERLDIAIAKSGIIEMLHEQFKQRELIESYVIVDAVEITKGFPFNAYTRYVMPLIDDESKWLNPELDSIYPGMAVINVLSNRRDLYVQIGLDTEDLRKVAMAIDAYLKIHTEEIPTNKPGWWSCPAPIIYFTSDSYQLGNMNLELFIWGKTAINSRLEQMIFERQENGYESERKWGIYDPTFIDFIGRLQGVAIDKLLDTQNASSD